MVSLHLGMVNLRPFWILAAVDLVHALTITSPSADSPGWYASSVNYLRWTYNSYVMANNLFSEPFLFDRLTNAREFSQE